MSQPTAGQLPFVITHRFLTCVHSSIYQASDLTVLMEFNSAWLYSYLQQMGVPRQQAFEASTHSRTSAFSKEQAFIIEDASLRRGLHYLADGLMASKPVSEPAASSEVLYVSSATWFGEEKLLSNEYFPQHRHFLRDSIIVSIERDAALDLLHTPSDYSTCMLECSGIWSWRNIEMSLALKHGSAAFRALHGLCHLFELIDAPNGHVFLNGLCKTECFELQFSHDRLAEFCELSRPRMTTMLTQMELHGMLSKGYRHITLLDTDRWRWMVHAMRMAPRVPYKADVDELAGLWATASPPSSIEPFNWGYRPRWSLRQTDWVPA